MIKDVSWNPNRFEPIQTLSRYPMIAQRLSLIVRGSVIDFQRLWKAIQRLSRTGKLFKDVQILWNVFQFTRRGVSMNPAILQWLSKDLCSGSCIIHKGERRVEGGGGRGRGEGEERKGESGCFLCTFIHLHIPTGHGGHSKSLFSQHTSGDKASSSGCQAQRQQTNLFPFV